MLPKGPVTTAQVHPLADVQLQSVGGGTRIWQFVVVLPGSCGERVPSLGEIPVKDVMRGLMKLQPHEYDELCRREADHVAATFEAGARIDEFERIVAELAQREANPRRSMLRAWFDTARDIMRFAIWKCAEYWSLRVKRLLRLGS